jgi:ABC-type bacteriocin/lantibiotic exporter with double-glycine peptidase domain
MIYQTADFKRLSNLLAHCYILARVGYLLELWIRAEIPRQTAVADDATLVELYDLPAKRNSRSVILAPGWKLELGRMTIHTPQLHLEGFPRVILQAGDRILVDGSSGAGKTSLLQIFAGIRYPDAINLRLFNGSDSRKISGFDALTTNILFVHQDRAIIIGQVARVIAGKNPNLGVLQRTLDIMKLSQLRDNEVSRLRPSQQALVLIATNVYRAMCENYPILIFDEIDRLLNDDISQTVVRTLLEVFNDRLIIMVTHRDKLKGLFNRRLVIENNVITCGV